MNRIDPPGPKERFPGELLLAFQRDPTGFLSRIATDYGDLAFFRIGWFNTVLVNHPDLVKEVLVTRNRLFMQGQARQQTRRLVGDATLAIDGEPHLRKRRLVQPILHRSHIEKYAETIVDFTTARSGRWQDGQTIDIMQELWLLTLRISCKAFFGTSIESEAESIHRTIDDVTSLFSPLMIGLADWLDRVPNPFTRRLQAATDRLDAKMQSLIDEHRAGGRSDFLSLLLSTHDGQEGGGLSDKEIRDEALEMFMASHGTIALAVGWSLYLLSLHPKVEACLIEELTRVSADRGVVAEDVERLTYTRLVLQEAMRLYPPTWALDRQTVQDWDVRGYRVPTGSLVLLSQWTMHHDSRFFPDPDAFRPERWAERPEESLPDFAYFPFGGGPHMCPGEHLAWFEGILLLATIVSKWRMSLAPRPRVELKPRFSLETKHGIPMRLQRRK